MTTSILPLIKGFALLLISYIGVVITYNDGVLIHIREGSVIWYLALIFSFFMLIKGIHNIYTFARRRVRCFHLSLLRQKRRNQRQYAKHDKTNRRPV